MTALEKPLHTFLSGYREIKLAILFGSQASGGASPTSDIDLALLADQPLSSEFLLQLMGNAGIQFGRPVDIIDLYHGPEPILGQVLRGKRILGDNATYARLLNRHLHNTADFLPLQQRILRERRETWTQ